MSSKELKEKTGVDTVSKKGDVYTVRKEFFYTGGKSATDLANRVLAAFPDAKIVDKGETWKPFKGGASTANSSHWWVKFTL